ncbi:hypothetical protein F5Y10DRAFT_36032 [Nemania abortiva]|nr:hypothetical protein F5Y10DRAFT_36032 [Nemania abortiva]
MAERQRESDRYSINEGQEGTGEGRVRATRSLRMSDEEWAAREERRIRFLRTWEEGQGDTKDSNKLQDQAGTTTDAGVPVSSQDPLVVPADSQERKPWESLVIGSLGENLSRIERKNREIEQQRFIVKHHEEHSPHQVEHNRRILDRLIDERSKMEDNEENNMPEDQREKGARISGRLELLRWTLDTSQCEDEKINIRAAIEGYESGQIPYSHDFTLLYGGRIVDVCPTYGSFCVDRSERLDRYFAEHGPGWLWHEPPLAGPGHGAVAMKGHCLSRQSQIDKYDIGIYQMTQEFVIHKDQVSRKMREGGRKRKRDSKGNEDGDASCQLEVLMDSGATYPIIVESDFARLGVDLSSYPAQGAMELNTLEGQSRHRFYEMYVSVCDDEGESLVGQGNDVVWPTERRSLGGFYPVLSTDDPVGDINFTHRLSGMVPFDACYLSSAPNMYRVWLGEDRRDVLGTTRLPSCLRYDTDRTLLLDLPEDIEALRREAHTPERVIFLHEYEGRPDLLLTDSDVKGTKGRSELAIGKYVTIDPKKPRKAFPQRIFRVEPRKGGVKIIPKRQRHWWKRFDGGRRSTKRKP